MQSGAFVLNNNRYFLIYFHCEYIFGTLLLSIGLSFGLQISMSNMQPIQIYDAAC